MSNKKNLESNKRLIYYFFKRLQINVSKKISKNINNEYLFLLSPPFSGSTLLNEILSSSKNVSCNNNIGLREGQHLPKVNRILFTDDRWNPEKKIDWNQIHCIWKKYWDTSKPVLLEKSPPNICRALNIEKEFSPSKFICLVRNPYAQAEGNMRRYNRSAKESAELAIKYLSFQKDNMEKLNNICLISYEKLTENTEYVKNKLINFLPKISDINFEKHYKAHNFRKIKKLAITNLNDEKINNLNTSDVKVMTSIFEKQSEILQFFNYKLL